MGGEFRTRQSSQATVSAGSPGMDEEELTRLGLDVARRQPLTLAELERMIDAAYKGAEPLRTAMEERLLGQVHGTVPFITPEQTALLDQSFEGARTQADQDVLRFAETLAGNRGLRLSDTPIGSPALRERARLAGTIASSRASAGIQLAQGQQAFNESVRQFQNKLQNAAMSNRLALGQVRPAGEGMAASLMNFRAATAPRAQTLESSTNIPSSILALGGTGLGLTALDRMFPTGTGAGAVGGLANLASGVKNHSIPGGNIGGGPADAENFMLDDLGVNPLGLGASAGGLGLGASALIPRLTTAPGELTPAAASYLGGLEGLGTGVSSGFGVPAESLLLGGEGAGGLGLPQVPGFAANAGIPFSQAVPAASASTLGGLFGPPLKGLSALGPALLPAAGGGLPLAAAALPLLPFAAGALFSSAERKPSFLGGTKATAAGIGSANFLSELGRALGGGPLPMLDGGIKESAI